jgi:hypothetical protein
MLNKGCPKKSDSLYFIKTSLNNIINKLIGVTSPIQISEEIFGSYHQRCCIQIWVKANFLSFL